MLRAQLYIHLEFGLIQLLRKQIPHELLLFALLIAEYRAPSIFILKLGNPVRKIPEKDLFHHPHRRIQCPGNSRMVVTGHLTCKVEAAMIGRLHNIREKGADLPRRELREGTRGIWVVVPIECMVVQRLILQLFHGHPVQRGKVSIDLFKKDLL